MKIFFSREKRYLFHILAEENQLLGTVRSKEIIDQTELEESDMIDPQAEP